MLELLTTCVLMMLVIAGGVMLANLGTFIVRELATWYDYTKERIRHWLDL